MALASLGPERRLLGEKGRLHTPLQGAAYRAQGSTLSRSLGTRAKARTIDRDTVHTYEAMAR